MGNKVDRPVRKYTNVRSYIMEIFWSLPKEKTSNPDYWPCLECDGKGWYYKPEDRDIIEGYKLAPRHKCTHCGGIGSGPKALVVAAYNAYVKDIRAKIAAWKEREAHRKRGLAKLNQAERTALGLD